MRRFLFCATLLAAVLLTSCKKVTVGQEEQKEYSVMTVGKQDITTVNKYPATIRGRQDVEIYPQVTGRITKVCIYEGQHVSKGQPLFIIDQVPYRAALQTAQANLRSARAEVATARLTYEGKQQLYKSKVSSLFELQKAHNALNTAEAAVAQAQAQVTDARNNLSYTVVSSPCNGVTGTIPYRVGTLVSSTMTSPLTTVSDNSVMYVYFSIPENNMISLIRQYGSSDKVLASLPQVRLFLNDGSEYEQKGKVESISGVLDGETGAVSLRAAFANPKGLLHSGGAGNVGLESKGNDLTIPQGATYELQDKVYAYRYVGGKAVSTRITVTPVDEQKLYIVRSGLKAGDVIIKDGVALLHDGESVKVKR